MDTSFLMQQHLSFVNTIHTKFNQLKFCSDILDAQSMLYAIKKNILPLRTAKNWKASFPTQPIPLRWKTLQNQDMSELLC
jgi:hypothetical protein